MVIIKIVHVWILQFEVLQVMNGGLSKKIKLQQDMFNQHNTQYLQGA